MFLSSFIEVVGFLKNDVISDYFTEISVVFPVVDYGLLSLIIDDREDDICIICYDMRSLGQEHTSQLDFHHIGC